MSRLPHVSEALVQTRLAVVVGAFLVALCAMAQLMVFGFVHFTEARWVEVEASANARALDVVESSTAGGPIGKRVLDEARRAEVQPKDVNRVLSSWDGVLRRVASSATSLGAMSAVGLLVVASLGVVIAAGGAVPGVGRAVAASMWSVVLAMGCLPWRDLMPSIPFGGVFGGYDVMVAGSEMVEAGRESAASLLAMFVLMPLAAIACAGVVAFRYREGVSEGIIVTSVSELDAQVEREIARIREKGPSGSTVRTVGALNRAIGAPAAAEAPVPSPAPEGEVPVGKKGRSWVSANDRRIGQPNPGDGLKRPI